MLLLLIVAGLIVAQSPASATGAPSLTVLGEGQLTVKAKSGKDSARAYLTVLNSAQTPAAITVDFAASSAEAVSVASVTPQMVAPGEVARITVTLAGLRKLTEIATGQLVVKGGTTPVARSMSIAPAPQPSASWAKVIFIGSLIAMVVLVLGIAILARCRDKWWKALKGKAPGPKWSYNSWATTLTAIGAILGTVLGSVTLPAVPREIDKDTLVRLNLLFGALVVTAPFVFQAIRSPRVSPADQDAGLWGFNWSLLLACSITCAAVLGELGTLALLAWELIGGGAWGWVAVAVVGLLEVLAVYYFLVTAWALATTEWSSLINKDKDSAANATRSMVVGIAAASRGETPPEIPAAVAAPIQRNWSLP